MNTDSLESSIFPKIFPASSKLSLPAVSAANLIPFSSEYIDDVFFAPLRGNLGT